MSVMEHLALADRLRSPAVPGKSTQRMTKLPGHRNVSVFLVPHESGKHDFPTARGQSWDALLHNQWHNFVSKNILQTTEIIPYQLWSIHGEMSPPTPSTSSPFKASLSKPMFSELDQENILLYYLEYEENLLDIIFQQTSGPITSKDIWAVTYLGLFLSFSHRYAHNYKAGLRICFFFPVTFKNSLS